VASIFGQLRSTTRCLIQRPLILASPHDVIRAIR